MRQPRIGLWLFLLLLECCGNEKPVTESYTQLTVYCQNSNGVFCQDQLERLPGIISRSGAVENACRKAGVAADSAQWFSLHLKTEVKENGLAEIRLNHASAATGKMFLKTLLEEINQATKSDARLRLARTRDEMTAVEKELHFRMDSLEQKLQLARLSGKDLLKLNNEYSLIKDSSDAVLLKLTDLEIESLSGLHDYGVLELKFYPAGTGK